MNNAINWFEIPVSSFDRAMDFYGKILDTKLQVQEMGGAKMGFFPAEGIGGAIVQGEDYEPSAKGTLIYLNGGKDLSIVLSRVESAGRKVLLGKKGLC